MERFLVVFMSVIVGVLAVCPDLEPVEKCLTDFNDTLMGEETNDDTICSGLSTAVKCVYEGASDCSELEESFLKPNVLNWIMLSQTLKCQSIMIGDEELRADAEDCTFWDWYNCAKEIMDDVGVSPANKTHLDVTIVDLRKWIMIQDRIMDNQEEACIPFDDKDTDAAQKCMDELEKRCIPLAKPMPEMEEDGNRPNSTNTTDRPTEEPAEDSVEMDDDREHPNHPLTAIFFRQAVERCGEACSDLADKKAAYESCATADDVKNSDENNLRDLAAAILADGLEEADKKRMCTIMESFVACVGDAVGECGPLGDDVRDTENKRINQNAALSICALSLDDVGRTTSDAGVYSVSVGIMVVSVLLPMM